MAESTEASLLLTPDKQNNPAIAFISDAHFHDVYAQFSDGAFEGLPNTVSGRNATIRSMFAQLTSSRLFNENYFAFLAALDDVADRGIRLVVLSGDFSDDGQPVHIRGLVRVLEEYTRKHGIQFFACNGNHDPVQPFNCAGGKWDYLGTGGKEQPIFSSGHKAGAPHNNPHMHQPVSSEEVAHLGYEPLMASLKNQGFYPQESHLYFETPFSSYTQSSYSFDKAREQARFHNRCHEICIEGTGGKYRKPHYTHGVELPDSSYLVEPVEGLWLLSIDSNVFIPKRQQEEPDNPGHGSNFHGSSDAGLNTVLTHKEYLLDWICSVTRRAKTAGKTVIAFGHYPAVDFFDGAGPEIRKVFGEDNFDQRRLPNDEVAKALAAAGIRIHFAGHMHFNHTGLKTFGDGSYLVNIQVPSLAAYVPAYKILRLKEDGRAEVKTVIMEQVKRFDELFEHYREEHNYLKNSSLKNSSLKNSNPERLWNDDILQARSYREFTSRHIAELTRLNLLPGWPDILRDMLYVMDGRQMLVMSLMDVDRSQQAIVEACRANAAFKVPEQVQPIWHSAERRAADKARLAGLNLACMSEWNGLDLAVDFYRLRSASELAFSDICVKRMKQYRLLSACLMEGDADTGGNHDAGLFRNQFQSLFKIMSCFSRGCPSINFVIDPGCGQLRKTD